MKPSRVAHRYIQHRTCRGESGILVGTYTEANERVMSDWVAGSWSIRRVLESNKRIKRCWFRGRAWYIDPETT